MSEALLGYSQAGHAIKSVECKHGKMPFQVWEYLPHNARVLGTISILCQSDRANYKATCKIHRGCFCMINNCHDSMLLLRWLQRAADCTVEEHSKLSKELRVSLGIKVRS
jgi:hypothetical protein